MLLGGCYVLSKQAASNLSQVVRNEQVHVAMSNTCNTLQYSCEYTKIQKSGKQHAKVTLYSQLGHLSMKFSSCSITLRLWDTVWGVFRAPNAITHSAHLHQLRLQKMEHR